MKPKSHTLFHFTKNCETLKKIIKNGFWPRYCLEDVGWLGYKEFDFIAYPMVCFCDIPISRIDEHVKFYGEYGIGLTKEWAEKNRLTPIMYISGNNHISETLRKIVDNATSLDEGKKDEATKIIRYFLAHTKPTEGNMVIGKEIIEKEFYQESEWRYVPKNGNVVDYMRRAEYEKDEVLSSHNELTREHCSIKFTPKDIKYIFVKSDTDIPEIINLIQTDLDFYPGADQKILMSRVISLESIYRDI